MVVAVGVAFLVVGVTADVGWFRYVFLVVGGVIAGSGLHRRLRLRGADERQDVDDRRAAAPSFDAATIAVDDDLRAAARFQVATPGFDRAQVTDLLRRVAERFDELQRRCIEEERRADELETELGARLGERSVAIAERGPGGPDSIAAPSFSVRLASVRFGEVDRGFDPDQVRAFLHVVDERIAELHRRVRAAVDRSAVAQQRLTAVDRHPA